MSFKIHWEKWTEPRVLEEFKEWINTLFAEHICPISALKFLKVYKLYLNPWSPSPRVRLLSLETPDALFYAQTLGRTYPHRVEEDMDGPETTSETSLESPPSTTSTTTANSIQNELRFRWKNRGKFGLNDAFGPDKRPTIHSFSTPLSHVPPSAPSTPSLEPPGKEDVQLELLIEIDTEIDLQFGLELGLDYRQVTSILSLPALLRLQRIQMTMHLVLVYIKNELYLSFKQGPDSPFVLSFRLAMDLGDPSAQVLKNTFALEGMLQNMLRKILEKYLSYPHFIRCPIPPMSPMPK